MNPLHRAAALLSLALVAAALLAFAPPAHARTYCPGPSTLEGIDVSHYQGAINWSAVAGSGRAFAIASVGDGYWRDPTFDGNYAGIHAAGMIRGAYQFFRPGLDAVRQADILLDAIGRTLAPGDLPPMLDVEVSDGVGPAGMNAAIHAWVDRVQSVTGRMPLIYTGAYFWPPRVGSGDFAGYPLVLPSYGPVCPVLPDPWDHWVMHQYSGSGRVPGIAGDVDLDVFNGTLADLDALAGGMRCTPHCEGSTIVGADCGRGECGAFGAGCADDPPGARCVFVFCPPHGDTDICLSDTQMAHCHDGAVTGTSDCGAFVGFCSTVGAPSGARCVSAFCVATPRDAPVEHDSCWLTGGSVLHCGGDGAPDVRACPAGQACSVIGGAAHCAPSVCPASGESDLCVDDRFIGHCVNGSLVSAGDCGAFGAYCSTSRGGAPQCENVFCVPDAHTPPVAHDVCLPDGRLARCNAAGNLEGATECAAPTRCVRDDEGFASCAAPGGASAGDAGAPPLSGASRDGGGGEGRCSDGGSADGGDGGCRHGAGAPDGGCGCRATPGRARGERAGVLAAMCVALAIAGARRRGRGRSGGTWRATRRRMNPRAHTTVHSFVLTCALLTASAACAPDGDDPSHPGGTSSESESLVGGVPIGQHPEVGVYESSVGVCTASLVTDRAVLTAGHCVGFANTPAPAPPGYEYGHFIALSGGRAYYYSVRQFVSLGHTTGRDDLAVLQLADRVPAWVSRTLTVAASDPPDGAWVLLWGFGCTDRATQANAFTRRALLGVWSNGSTHTDRLCPGDSGGPMTTAAGEIVRVNSAYRTDRATDTDVFADPVFNRNRVALAAYLYSL